MIATPKPLLLLVLVALTGCGKWADQQFCGDPRCEWTDREWSLLVSLANPEPPEADQSNIYWDLPAARQLGQKFYFDTGFSGPATQTDAINRPSPPARQPPLTADGGATSGSSIKISCATCHDPTRGGHDTTSVPGNVSVGAGWTDVNALTTINSAYRKLVFWNGRIDSLWALNVIVSESNTTMNGNRLAVAHRIFDVYKTEYEAIFGPIDPTIGTDLLRFPANAKPLPPTKTDNGEKGVWENMADADRQTVNTILGNWGKAIAAYEYELVSVNSLFDQFVAAGKSSTLIPGAAKRGARLFVGKAGCIDCHNGPQLTDEDFHNVGVTQIGLAVPTTSLCTEKLENVNEVCDCVDGPRCPPWGALEGLWRLQSDARYKTWLRNGPFGDPRKMDTSRDAYRQRALTPDLKGAWRTPSLRNVALTAPYMHDGSLATLEDVVWHYNTGGRGESGERVGDPVAEIKPLGLTDQEAADLVAFLETLTGDPVRASWAQAPK